MSATKGVGDRIAQERRLKAARDERDVDQRDLALALGVTPGAVSRWENGLTVPKDDVIEKLARYFGVTPGWLRYGQEPRKATAPPPMRSLGEIERMPEPEQVSKPVRNIAGARKRRPR